MALLGTKFPKELLLVLQKYSTTQNNYPLRTVSVMNKCTNSQSWNLFPTGLVLCWSLSRIFLCIGYSPKQELNLPTLIHSWCSYSLSIIKFHWVDTSWQHLRSRTFKFSRILCATSSNPLSIKLVIKSKLSFEFILNASHSKYFITLHRKIIWKKINNFLN